MNTIDRRSFLAAGLALAAPAAARANAAPQDPKGAAEPAAPAEIARPGRTPNTKFAANVEMWWSGMPFLQRIAMASDFGYPAVEFWPWRGKDINAIEDVTRDLEIEVAQFTAWGFSPGMNDPGNLPGFVREIRESCEIARRLRCKKMTVVAGDDVPGMTREQMHANVIEALKRVAPIAEATGVMLILEPMNIRHDHKGHCLYGSPDGVRICREVGSTHVKLNWDLYHMQISEGDLCRRLAEGFEQVGYLQLADNPGRHEPGTGEVNYARVLRAAKELGYDGYVGLECTPAEDELTAARRIHAADTW